MSENSFNLKQRQGFEQFYKWIGILHLLKRFYELIDSDDDLN